MLRLSLLPLTPFFLRGWQTIARVNSCLTRIRYFPTARPDLMEWVRHSSFFTAPAETRGLSVGRRSTRMDTFCLRLDFIIRLPPHTFSLSRSLHKIEDEIYETRQKPHAPPENRDCRPWAELRELARYHGQRPATGHPAPAERSSPNKRKSSDVTGTETMKEGLS